MLLHGRIESLNLKSNDRGRMIYNLTVAELILGRAEKKYRDQSNGGLEKALALVKDTLRVIQPTVAELLVSLSDTVETITDSQDRRAGRMILQMLAGIVTQRNREQLGGLAESFSGPEPRPSLNVVVPDSEL